MNIFVSSDNNWDNYALITKYISLDYMPEDVKINHVYGKHLQHISKICNQKMIHLYRRSVDPEFPAMSYYNIIKNMNVCIIFHNFTEYNTPSSFVIDACKKNNIQFIIISEHNKKCYLNGDVYDGKFKNALKIAINSQSNSLDFKCIENDYEYTNLFINVVKDKKPVRELRENLKRCYDRLKDYQSNNSIIYIDN